MASKVETEYGINIYDLKLAHADIVSMMNDADVDIADRSVSETQRFEVIVQKGEQSRQILQELKPSESVVFRFRVVSGTPVETELGDVDIESV